jgi:hypothetical protein
MTVEQMRATVSNTEYHQWRAFYTWRNEMEKLELAKVGRR